MANPDHLKTLLQGVAAWNAWRRQREPDLQGTDLGGADLSGSNLSKASLHSADLSNAGLNGAILVRANLHGADLRFRHVSKIECWQISRAY
jgi:uncharacterized protein YjbI with pentapeptide repeats